MRERIGRILRIACLLLAVLVVYELAHIVLRANPLAHVVIPELPTLPSETTNTTPVAVAAANSTNSTHTAASAGTGPTNATGKINVNLPIAVASTNVAGAAPSPSVVENAGANSIAGTNIMPHPVATGANETNFVTVSNAGTNAPPVAKLTGGGTNASGAAGMALAGRGLNSRGAGVSELPPEIKARVNRIYESEILGQAIRPLPMALIGIGGDVAFLRAASGQTGLIKEGETLDDLKLLRIGINRVLVEQAGQKRELTIFDGYGGESLLPQKKEHP